LRSNQQYAEKLKRKADYGLDGTDIAGSAGADGAAGTAGIFLGSVALSAGSAGRTGKYSGPVWPQAANSRVQQATPAA
jgi:hypothetical protein